MRRYVLAGLAWGVAVGAAVGVLLLAALSLPDLPGLLEEQSLPGVLRWAVGLLATALGLGLVAGLAAGTVCGLVAPRLAARGPRLMSVLVLASGTAAGVLWLIGVATGTFAPGPVPEGEETLGAISALIFQILVLAPSLLFGLLMTWSLARADRSPAAARR